MEIADDATLDGTWASTSLAIAADGTCPRHPQIILRSTGEDGYVYQAESCLECDKEFQEQKTALRDRKRELDRKLQELEASGEQVPDSDNQEDDTMISTEDINSLRENIMKHSSSNNRRSMTDEEVNHAPPLAQATPALSAPSHTSMYSEENGYSRPPLTLESLANQMNMMQQMQDWMLRQKETELNLLRNKVEAQQRELLQKEVEIALLKEKLSTQEDRMQQELKLLKLASSKRSGSGKSKEIHIQELHVQVGSNHVTDANGEVDPKMVQAATQAATTAALEEAAAAASSTKKMVVNAKPPPPKMHATSTMAPAMAPAMASASSSQSMASTVSSSPTTASRNKVDPPSNKANNMNSMMKSDTNSSVKTLAMGANLGEAASASSATANANMETKNEITFNPKTTLLASNDEKDEEDEESGEDTFDPDGFPWKASMGHGGGSLKRKDTPMMQSQQVSRTIGNIRVGSTGLPTKDQVDPHSHGVPIRELQVDDDAPPTVPLYEEVTIATLEQQISGQFPRNQHHDPDDTTSVGQTVASSTYGEDRQKVVSQVLLDPYGDKGQYSGVVLRSTGMPHGLGRMVYEDDGRTYEGDWRHGRWHGYGRATFANGDSYEGEYRFDQRHGRGKYSWHDGRIYDGDFSEDKRHGRGTFFWPDGATYEGDFHQGQREGHGRYTFSDGGYYVGSWIDGRYEGFGECHWEDGRKYKGEWRAGMAHGQGVETYPDGRVRHDGQWIDDEPIR